MAKKTFKVEVSSAAKRQALEALLVFLGFDKTGPDAFVETKAVVVKTTAAKKVVTKATEPATSKATKPAASKAAKPATKKTAASAKRKPTR